MAYTKSIARKDFEQKISYFKDLTVKTSKAGDVVPYDISQSVYKNAIFQCSACLEEYIKQLLTDWIDMLHRNNCPLTSAPKSLILLAAGKAQKNIFTQYIADSDESKFIKSLSQMQNLSSYFDNRQMVKNLIRHTEFVADKKYPSPKNYIVLFGRFGLSNFFDRINKTGKKDYRLILDSFNSIRSSIAHEYPAPAITHLDVKTKLDSIANFVYAVDKTMYGHIKDISGVMCWKS